MSLSNAPRRIAAVIGLALLALPARAAFAEDGNALLDLRIAAVSAREDADLATLDALMVAQRAFQLAVDTADASDPASVDVAHAVKDAYVSVLRANAAVRRATAAETRVDAAKARADGRIDAAVRFDDTADWFATDAADLERRAASFEGAAQ